MKWKGLTMSKHRRCYASDHSEGADRKFLTVEGGLPLQVGKRVFWSDGSLLGKVERIVEGRVYVVHTYWVSNVAEVTEHGHVEISEFEWR